MAQLEEVRAAIRHSAGSTDQGANLHSRRPVKRHGTVIVWRPFARYHTGRVEGIAEWQLKLCYMEGQACDRTAAI